MWLSRVCCFNYTVSEIYREKKVGSLGDLALWSYNNISPPFMINSSTLKEEERAIFRGRNKSVLYSANITVRLAEHSEEQRGGFCRSGLVDCKSGLSLCHCSKKKKKAMYNGWLTPIEACTTIIANVITKIALLGFERTCCDGCDCLKIDLSEAWPCIKRNRKVRNTFITSEYESGLFLPVQPGF